MVKQRLRLAAASPKLLDVYADDGMTLQQLMAFTVANDQARQEQVWEALGHTYSKEPFISVVSSLRARCEPPIDVRCS